jgi:aminoglycoside/choline kinase family phosphotransferase
LLFFQHGDFHFNNLLFKREAGGRIRVMIVDWQLAYSGRATGDLSYLLMSSLSHEVGTPSLSCCK